MACYIDSSFLLSLLLEQSLPDKIYQIWKNDNIRFSSLILNAECLIALRRINKFSSIKLPKNWLSLKEIELNTLLNEINMILFDNSILEIIKIIDTLIKK